jgi:hypothetical protein
VIVSPHDDVGRQGLGLGGRREERQRRTVQQRQIEVRHAGATVFVRGRRVRGDRVVIAVVVDIGGGVIVITAGVVVVMVIVISTVVVVVADGTRLRTMRMVVAMRRQVRDGSELGREQEHAEQQQARDGPNMLEGDVASPHGCQ